MPTECHICQDTGRHDCSFCIEERHEAESDQEALGWAQPRKKEPCKFCYGEGTVLCDHCPANAEAHFPSQEG